MILCCWIHTEIVFACCFFTCSWLQVLGSFNFSFLVLTSFRLLSYTKSWEYMVRLVLPIFLTLSIAVIFNFFAFFVTLSAIMLIFFLLNCKITISIASSNSVSNKNLTKSITIFISDCLEHNIVQNKVFDIVITGVTYLLLHTRSKIVFCWDIWWYSKVNTDWHFNCMLLHSAFPQDISHIMSI